MAVDLERALAIQGWMEPDELQWLAEQASGCQRIVELGSWKGRSTRAMLDNSQAHVVVVDAFEANPDEPQDATLLELRERGQRAIIEEWTDNLRDHLNAGRVTLFPMHSRDAAFAVWLDTGRKARTLADLLFIDADHSYEGCLDDIALYGGLVKPGGVISGHDYTTEIHPGVKRAVDEYFGDRVQQGPGSIWWVQR